MRQEPEAGRFARMIELSPSVGISAASLLEATVVVGRDGRADLDDLLDAIAP